MKKREWIEQHEEEQERYGRSILSHGDHDSMKDYEFSLMHHDDDEYDSMNDYEFHIGHFSD